MADPITQGNMVVLKGDKQASGRDKVVSGAISAFVSENDANRAVYVCLNSKSSKLLEKSLSAE